MCTEVYIQCVEILMGMKTEQELDNQKFLDTILDMHF